MTWKRVEERRRARLTADGQGLMARRSCGCRNARLAESTSAELLAEL